MLRPRLCSSLPCFLELLTTSGRIFLVLEIPGYDLVTGIGSLQANNLIPALVAAP
jgi:hypothetical protein